MLLDRVAKGEIDPSYLATQWLPLDSGAEAYAMFKDDKDGCLRAVLAP